MHQMPPHGDACWVVADTCTTGAGNAHTSRIPRLQALGVVAARCSKIDCCTGTLSISLTKNVSIEAAHSALLGQPTLVVSEALELSHPATESQD